MKKLSLLTATLCLCWMFSYAQMGTMLVKKSDRGLYIDHKVVAKEGLYSIGRIYFVHPHHLAAFNGLDPNAGLNLGQELKIPLTDTNFNQRNDDGLALYYVVGAGDGLSAISRVHNRVPVDRLRKWNNLKTDNINKGSKLIVGYLTMSPQTTASVPVQTSREETRTEVVKEEPTTPPAKEQTKEARSELPSTTSSSSEKDQVKNEPVLNTAPVKEAAERVVEQPVSSNNSSVATASGSGYFRPWWEQQIKSNPAGGPYTVTAGIFKTTSGWQDGKFYLLIDKVPTGSIVRVINPDNGKAIYAKVLGEMNGIRQDQGLNIRLSNAAASTLGVADQEKFVVQVSY